MKKALGLMMILICSYQSFAQDNVGIGTLTPNSNAILELQNAGNPLGLLLPRQDISTFTLGVADAGMMVYNTTDNKVYTWNGTNWISSTSEWGVNGNDIFNLNSGNVGIGTSSPSTKLEIQGTGSFFLRMKSTESNSSAYSELEFGRDNGLGGFFKTGGIGTPGSGDYLQIFSPQFIDFNTNFSSRMRIASTGSVTIGSGSFTDLFNVSGGNITLFRSDGNNLEFTFNADANGIPWTIGVDDAANADFYISQSSDLSNAKMFIRSSTGVGIGTTNPQADLHVFPNNGGNGDIAIGTTGTTSFWNMAMTTSNERFILAYNNGAFNDYLIMSSAGNMGIGTPFPLNRLDVEGGASIGAGYSGTFTAPSNGLIVEGSVGIGTTSPLYPLVVNGQAQFTGTVGIGSPPDAGIDLLVQSGSASSQKIGSFNTSITTFSSSTSSLILESGTSNIGTNTYTISSGTGGIFLVGQQNTSGMLLFRHNTGGLLTVLSTSHFGPYANAGLDLGNSSFRWNRVYYTTGILGTSDRRFKENIQSMNYGLNHVMRLNPVTFTWKEKPEQGTQLGLIAQDVREIIPEIIDEADNESKDLMMNHLELIPVMINAIKELKYENDNLKAEIDELKQR